MILPIKIEFREYPSGTFADWSALLSSAPVISRRVESEIEGEAGLIVFDNAAVMFRYDEDNLVYAVFSDEESLSTAVRYVFQIWNNRKGFFAEDFELVTHTGDTIVTDTGDTIGANYLDEQSTKVYEGMLDFTTIKWPHQGRLISFDIMDKLSAISIIDNGTNQRQNQIANTDRLSVTYPFIGHIWVLDDENWAGLGLGNVILICGFELISTEFGVNPDVDNPVQFSADYYQKGEVIRHPMYTSEVTTPNYRDLYYVVIDSGTTTKVLLGKTFYFTWIKVDTTPAEITTLSQQSGYHNTMEWWQYHFVHPQDYTFSEWTGSWWQLNVEERLQIYNSILIAYRRSKQYYTNADIGIYGTDAYSRTVLLSFNAVPIIAEIIKQYWPETSLVTKPASFEFPIPLNYISKMVYNLPLGEEPLAALKMLANSITDEPENNIPGCYIYIDKDGNAVLHTKNSIATSGTTRTIGTTKIINKEKKFFWNKLVDGVTVTVKSWVRDSAGEFLEGQSTKTLQVAGSTGQLKPRNEVSKDLLTTDITDTTQQDLDDRAGVFATNILNYYGKRRAAWDLLLQLDTNTEQWELVDNIEIDGVDYFFTSIEMDLVDRTVSLEAVEAVGHEYDLRQIVITPGN